MKKFMKWFVVAVFLVVGLVLVFNRQLLNFAIENMTRDGNRQEIVTKNKNKGDFEYSHVKDVDSRQVAKALTVTKPQDVIGKVALPAVRINLPIYAGVANQNLARGAGTMKANQKMGQGNYGLAGHHMDDPNVLFSPLVRSKVGQKIYLTDGKKVYIYKIRTEHNIEPTDVSVVDDVKNKKLVTLITCSYTPNGKKRWLVQGELIKKGRLTAKTQKIFE